MKEGSEWANPYKINHQTTREASLKKYESMLLRNGKLQDSLSTLCYSQLGCWCAPLPCHGNILIDQIKRDFFTTQTLYKPILFVIHNFSPQTLAKLSNVDRLVRKELVYSANGGVSAPVAANASVFFVFVLRVCMLRSGVLRHPLFACTQLSQLSHIVVFSDPPFYRLGLFLWIILNLLQTIVMVSQLLMRKD